uniref:Uncharacterized protein n=1 Tax=Solanum tuberosum TaxID=4113 RepID=M1DPS0_SOLTU
MAITSPKVPVCQALKEKVKSARKRSSRRVAKKFCDAVLDCPKLRNLKMRKAKEKRVVVANVTLPSCSWLARKRGLKTKITELMVHGYWVAVSSARECES